MLEATALNRSSLSRNCSSVLLPDLAMSHTSHSRKKVLPFTNRTSESGNPKSGTMAFDLQPVEERRNNKAYGYEPAGHDRARIVARDHSHQPAVRPRAEDRDTQCKERDTRGQRNGDIRPFDKELDIEKVTDQNKITRHDRGHRQRVRDVCGAAASRSQQLQCACTDQKEDRRQEGRPRGRRPEKVQDQAARRTGLPSRGSMNCV